MGRILSDTVKHKMAAISQRPAHQNLAVLFLLWCGVHVTFSTDVRTTATSTGGLVTCITAYNLTCQFPTERHARLWQDPTTAAMVETVILSVDCDVKAAQKRGSNEVTETMSLTLTKTFPTADVFDVEFASIDGADVAWKTESLENQLLATIRVDLMTLFQKKIALKALVFTSRWKQPGYSILDVGSQAPMPNPTIQMSSFLPRFDRSSHVTLKYAEVISFLQIPDKFYSGDVVPSYALSGIGPNGKLTQVFSGDSETHQQQSDHWVTLVYESPFVDMDITAPNNVVFNISTTFKVTTDDVAPIREIPLRCLSVFQLNSCNVMNLLKMGVGLAVIFVGMTPFFIVDYLALHSHKCCIGIMMVVRCMYMSILLVAVSYIFQQATNWTCYALYKSHYLVYIQYIILTFAPSGAWAWLVGYFWVNIYTSSQVDLMTDSLITGYMGKKGTGRFSTVSPLVAKIAAPLIVTSIWILQFKLYFVDLYMIGPALVNVFAVVVVLPVWMMRNKWNRDRRIPPSVIGTCFICVPISGLLLFYLTKL